ncbi:MAG: hypothetical protein HC821_03585, partial [Lewinella sp.]|nr:hypothetical protein [Lewinella sp.]
PLSPSPGVQQRLRYAAPGSYPLALLASRSGCADSSLQTLTVVDTVAAPQLSCGPRTLNSLQLQWPAVFAALSYELSIDGQSPITGITDTFYQLQGLLPAASVNLRLRARGGACGLGPWAELVCQSLGCPPLTVSLEPLDTAICLSPNTAPWPLRALVRGGNGQGASSSWSGSGVVNGFFDAAAAGPGTFIHRFTYTEQGPCQIEDSLRVVVTEQPSAAFSLTPAVTCVSQNTSLTYQGNATAGTTFDWGFGGLNVVSGSGPGPYVLVANAEGSYPLALSLSTGACTSIIYQDTLRVLAPLPAPQLRCGQAALNTLTVVWDPVAGASSYALSIDGAAAIVVADTFYLLLAYCLTRR